MLTLRAGRRLRGTPLDPFGRFEVRVVANVSLYHERLAALMAEAAGTTMTDN